LPAWRIEFCGKRNQSRKTHFQVPLKYATDTYDNLANAEGLNLNIQTDPSSDDAISEEQKKTIAFYFGTQYGT
jgi:hypothetical protein